MAPPQSVARLAALACLLALACSPLAADASRPRGDRFREYRLTIENLAFNQPLSPVLVATHDGRARIFEFAQPASEELSTLAEFGDANPLAASLQRTDGVQYVDVLGGVPPGETRTSTIRVYDGANYLTLASMAVNTNDCFVALNSELIRLVPMARPVPDSQQFLLPGLDAGSEQNNELCSSIPGPACAPSSGNVRSGNGEGFVHVHRGFFGINEGKWLDTNDLSVRGTPLEAVRYDWRNPMARVVIEEIIN